MSMVIQIQNTYKFWHQRIHINFLLCNTNLKHSSWILMSMPGVVKLVAFSYESSDTCDYNWQFLLTMMCLKHLLCSQDKREMTAVSGSRKFFEIHHSGSLKKSHVVKIVGSYCGVSFKLIISHSFHALRS